MSITKVNDTTFKVDARIKVKSQIYRIRETFTGGKKAAQEREAELKKALHLEAAKKSGSLKIHTFGEALQYYKENRDLKRSECLINRLQADLGSIPLPDLADRFYDWMKAVKSDYSTPTMNRFIAWSKAAINEVIGSKMYTGVHPLRDDNRFKRQTEQPRKQRLNNDQKTKLLEVIQEHAPHIYPVVQFAILIPCRKDELVSMRREWYDMINNYIVVPGDITKNKSAVVKPVPDELKSYMRNIPIESDYIFYRKEGDKYVPLGDFRKSWHKCLELAGIADFRFHDLRRTSYTDLILSGDHSKVVQAISGHKTDMSRVYLAIDGIEAAKSYQERRKVDTKVDTFCEKRAEIGG
jgi:integrase